MKKVLLYFFGASFIVWMVLGIVLSRGAALSSGVDGVLKLMSKGYLEQAYTFFSQDFQSRYPFPTFATMVENSGLTDYQTAKWDKEKMGSDQQHAYLSGVITTNKNTFIYLQIEFIKEKQTLFTPTWFINNLRVKQSNEQQ